MTLLGGLVISSSKSYLEARDGPDDPIIMQSVRGQVCEGPWAQLKPPPLTHPAGLAAETGLEPQQVIMSLQEQLTPRNGWNLSSVLSVPLFPPMFYPWDMGSQLPRRWN